MTDNKPSEQIESDSCSSPESTSRRKLLKTTGLTSGAVAAASVWNKPVLDSLVLPVHAQTSVDDEPVDDDIDPLPTETVLSGPTEASPPVSAKVNNSNQSFSDLSSIFVDQTAANYKHCLTLTIPNSSNAPTSVDVRLDGPTIYYNSNGEFNGTYYYTYSANFSGSTTANLTQSGNDFEFTTIINGLEISGTIDQSLSSATGELNYSSGAFIDILPSNSNGYGGFMGSPSANPGNGYGAYWQTTENSQCMVGTGPSNPVFVGPNPD